MALIDNLVSYWKMDETSDGSGAVTRVDSHGNNDLTDNNNIASGTGIINNGADLESGSSEYLSITDAAQTGLDFATDFSFSMWIKPESVPGANSYFYLINKGFEAGVDRQYAFIYETFGGSFWDLNISFNGSASASVLHQSHTPSAGTWYHMVVSYDASAGTADFWINGTAQTQGTGGPTSIHNGDDDLFIGRGETLYYDGLIDEFGMWSRTLTSDEVAELYNGGAGLSYDDFGGGATVFPQPTLLTLGVG